MPPPAKGVEDLAEVGRLPSNAFDFIRSVLLPPVDGASALFESEFFEHPVELLFREEKQRGGGHSSQGTGSTSQAGEPCHDFASPMDEFEDPLPWGLSEDDVE